MPLNTNAGNQKIKMKKSYTILFAILLLGNANVFAQQDTSEHNIKFLVFSRLNIGVTRTQVAPVLKDEVEKTWQLQMKGIIKDIYYVSDKSGVVFTIDAKDTTNANRILSVLPLVKQKLIHFDYVGLIPYNGYDILFTDETIQNLKTKN